MKNIKRIDDLILRRAPLIWATRVHFTVPFLVLYFSLTYLFVFNCSISYTSIYIVYNITWVLAIAGYIIFQYLLVVRTTFIWRAIHDFKDGILIFSTINIGAALVLVLIFDSNSKLIERLKQMEVDPGLPIPIVTIANSNYLEIEIRELLYQRLSTGFLLDSTFNENVSNFEDAILASKAFFFSTERSEKDTVINEVTANYMLMPLSGENLTSEKKFIKLYYNRYSERSIHSRLHNLDLTARSILVEYLFPEGGSRYDSLTIWSYKSSGVVRYSGPEDLQRAIIADKIRRVVPSKPSGMKNSSAIVSGESDVVSTITFVDSLISDDLYGRMGTSYMLQVIVVISMVAFYCLFLLSGLGKIRFLFLAVGYVFVAAFGLALSNLPSFLSGSENYDAILWVACVSVAAVLVCCWIFFLKLTFQSLIRDLAALLLFSSAAVTLIFVPIFLSPSFGDMWEFKGLWLLPLGYFVVCLLQTCFTLTLQRYQATPRV